MPPTPKAPEDPPALSSSSSPAAVDSALPPSPASFEQAANGSKARAEAVATE
jgi:hypothetical protein